MNLGGGFPVGGLVLRAGEKGVVALPDERVPGVAEAAFLRPAPRPEGADGFRLLPHLRRRRQVTSSPLAALLHSGQTPTVGSTMPLPLLALDVQVISHRTIPHARGPLSVRRIGWSSSAPGS